MDYQSFKKAVIAQAEALGITEYELYYESGSETSVGVFQHEINEFSSSAQGGGVCFRCIVGGKMGYASTQALNENEAKAIVVKAADNAAVLEADEQVFLCEGGKAYEALNVTPYDLPAVDALISKALETQEKLYAADPAVIDGCQTQAFSEHSELAIYNSKGLDLHWENNAAGLVVVSVVTDGKEMSNAYEIKLGELDKLDTDKMVAKATEDAKRKLGGEPPATGVYPVVFDPEAMASLLGVFSSVFSSENAQKGLSRLGSMEGEVIAAPCVTLVDDPFHPESRAQRNFDSEGCPTRKKNVIEGGKLNTLLYNMKTAAVAGKETTGNAAKAGYAGAVNVRPFTMYLDAGELTEEQILQKAGNGVLITDLGGLHAGANPISGDFSLQSSGFLIQDGKKGEYIKSFTVAGNFYDMLKNITALSDKVTLPSPFGITTFGSPYVLVENLSIAGK